MNILRMFRLGLRVAEWATPHIKEMHRARHFNRTEGQRHLQARNYAEAEKHLTQALTEKHSKKYRAEMLAQLAKAQSKQNKLDSAEEAARAAVALAKTPVSQWEAVESLAAIQTTQGNAYAAIATLESMENRDKRSSKPNFQKLAKAARQRGKLLLQSGRSEEGLAALDQSVKLSEKVWGPEDLETAHGLAEIGAIHGQLGNHKEAQRMLGQALKIYKVTSGYNSEEASRGLNNLAMSLEASGDLEAAAAEYERFITASELQVGFDATSVHKAKVRLAVLYVHARRSSAARELLTPVIGMLEHNPNETLRQALQVMAEAEDQAGRSQEAALWRERAAGLSLA